MCTLPILPGAAGGYLLGHNRDESVQRAAGLPPRAGSRDGRSFLAPRDPEAGGSWIGVNDHGITYALLNAAHADPGSLPASPPSRGRILDAVIPLDAPGAVGEILSVDPQMPQTKGFHLVMAVPGTDREPARAIRFRWDGRSLGRDEHALPALFVSSGFDQAGAEKARSAAWHAFLGTPGPKDASALKAWLASHAPRRGVLSACMHGKVAATVSRTLVEIAPRSARMIYHAGAPCDPTAKEHSLHLPRR